MQIKQRSKDVLKKVFEVLSQDEIPSTIDQVLKLADVSRKQYEEALKVTKHGSTVVLKRSPKEINTNYYNPDLLRAWGANIDVQYCLDPYACITYMVAYITKDEREMGQILQAVSEETMNETWAGKMKKCAKAFLNARELSAQEAVYRLLSFPLFKCSFRTVFVPADQPQNRFRLIKPMSTIREMDDGDEDIFQKNIIDKYAARPSFLRDVCLANFAAWYCPVYSSKNPVTEDSEGQENTSENCSHFELQGGCGRMRRANTPAVLRYHKISKVKDPQSYYYSQIILFRPWQNEQTLLSLASFEEYYKEHEEEINTNRAKFEHHAAIIEDALDQFEQNGPPAHMYDDISPNTRQEDGDCKMEGQVLDPESALLHPSEDLIQTSTQFHVPASKAVSYSIEMRPGVLTEENYRTLIRSLNTKQRSVFQHVGNWCTSISMEHKTGNTPPPLHLFVSGGAGTGKSHLISAIYQMALRQLQQEGESPDEIKVTLTAPTGTAAHNISGTTLHSAFLLPLGQTKSYKKLSDDKRNALRTKAGALQLLIIDEISMVGSDILLQIHYRLCEIKSSTEPFGGISVIVFGDLYQLPPVLQQFIFKPVSDPFVNIYGSLWNNFNFTELQQIMRQNEDLTFANLLNRVRTASYTEDDIETLKTRQCSSDHQIYPSHILHVFSTNKAVDEHNNHQLNQLTSQRETLIAIDKKPDVLKSYDISQDSRFTGGLPTQNVLAVGAKVMLTRNIDISDGLVNGAHGIIVAFLKRSSSVDVVFVHFEGVEVGKNTRQKTKYFGQLRQFPQATPIERTEISFTINKDRKGLSISRQQFPLKLCWACTVHKVQGITVSQIVVSFKHRYTDGQAYVALSRVKNLQGLYILDFQQNKIRANKDVQKEMQRLSEKNSLDDSYLFFNKSSHPSVCCIISALNTRSVVLHSEDIANDPLFQSSDVTVLSETWLSEYIRSDAVISSDFNVCRSDKPSTDHHRHSGGVAVVVRKSLPYKLLQIYSDIHLQIVVVTTGLLHDKQFNIVGIYNSPNPHNKMQHTLAKVNHLLDEIKASNDYPIIIVGDINEDTLNAKSNMLFKNTLEGRGFHQHIKKPTHGSGSCVDHFYSNFDYQVEVQHNSCYFSDHDWVSCKLQLR